MKHTIAVTFIDEHDSDERRLGSIDLVDHQTEGGTQLLRAPPTQFTLRDGSHIEISASYLPSNDGTSLVVCHEGKQIALVLTDWGNGNPYLGIQVSKQGFLHIY